MNVCCLLFVHMVCIIYYYNTIGEYLTMDVERIAWYLSMHCITLNQRQGPKLQLQKECGIHYYSEELSLR